METVSIKNAGLFGAFAKSFNNLAQVKTISASTKFDIVKLRKRMIETAEIIKEAKPNQEEFEQLMSESHTYEFNKIDPKLIVNSLSADDLFNLEPLLKE